MKREYEKEEEEELEAEKKKLSFNDVRLFDLHQNSNAICTITINTVYHFEWRTSVR